MTTQLSPNTLSFEDLKQVNEHGAEYWSARDLQPLLGYDQWRRFADAIKRAQEACKESGNEPHYHFAGAGKMITIRPGAGQPGHFAGAGNMVPVGSDSECRGHRVTSSANTPSIEGSCACRNPATGVRGPTLNWRPEMVWGRVGNNLG